MHLDPVLSFLCLAVLLASFFWARGIVRGRKDDLIAGFAILAVLCGLLLVLNQSSAVFGTIGGLNAVFGLVTLVASNFAKPGCPLNPNERGALGVGFMVVGLALSMIA